MVQNVDDARVEADTPVTTVIRHQPVAGAANRYEAWLKEIIPVAQSFAGHQSVSVIRPLAASEAYTIVLHFDSVGNLRAWLDSEARRRLIDKIAPYLRVPEAVDIKTGFEFWFTPPLVGKPARPYKQFLVTLSAIFPISVIVSLALQPVFTWLPLLALPGLRQLISATILVGLMVYVVMPRYTRAVSRWLFR